MAETMIRPKGERYGTRGLVGPALAIFLSASMLAYAGAQLLIKSFAAQETTPNVTPEPTKPQSSLLIPPDFKTSLTLKVLQAAEKTLI